GLGRPGPPGPSRTTLETTHGAWRTESGGPVPGGQRGAVGGIARRPAAQRLDAYGRHASRVTSQRPRQGLSGFRTRSHGKEKPMTELAGDTFRDLAPAGAIPNDQEVGGNIRIRLD